MKLPAMPPPRLHSTTTNEHTDDSNQHRAQNAIHAARARLVPIPSRSSLTCIKAQYSNSSMMKGPSSFLLSLSHHSGKKPPDIKEGSRRSLT